MPKQRGPMLALLLVLMVASICVGAAFAAGPAGGTYARNVTSQELLKAGSGAPHGIWTLRTTARGFFVAAKGQGVVPERAAWTATKVVVGDTPGAISIFCGATVKGTYRWSHAGARLVLALVRDACKDRAGVLVGTWKQSK